VPVGGRTENTRKAEAIDGRVIDNKNRKIDVDNEAVVDVERKSGRKAIKKRDQINTKPGSKFRTLELDCDVTDDDDDDNGVEGTGAETDDTNT